MRLFLALLAAVIVSSPATARTLSMPSDADISLLKAYLHNDPPDFEALASSDRSVIDASEFDRASVMDREVARLRNEYLAMRDVDQLVLRVDARFGEYDGTAGGFRLQAFEPDRFVKFGFTRLTFDNRTEFEVWKLPVAEARKILSLTGSGRTVTLEIAVRPFAASTSSRQEIRTQVRSVRLMTPGGRTLDTMTTDAPEAKILSIGAASSEIIADDRLDVLGLRIGASTEEFEAWAGRNGFEAETVEEPFRYDFPATYLFSAKPEGLPKRTTAMIAPRRDFFGPLPVVEDNFTCGSRIDAERTCGSVTFSGEPAVADKRIVSIRMSQSIAGATPERVAAKLSEKFGPHIDVFDATVSTPDGTISAKQFVWGNSFPQDARRSGAAALTGLDRNWQIEAVVFEPELSRTVVVIQLIGLPAAGSGSTEARF